MQQKKKSLRNVLLEIAKVGYAGDVQSSLRWDADLDAQPVLTCVAYAMW